MLEALRTATLDFDHNPTHTDDDMKCDGNHFAVYSVCSMSRLKVLDAGLISFARPAGKMIDKFVNYI